MYSKDDFAHYIQNFENLCWEIIKELDKTSAGDLAYFLQEKSWDFRIEIKKDDETSAPVVNFPVEFDDQVRSHLSEVLTRLQQQKAYLCCEGLRLIQELRHENLSISEKIVFGVCLERVRSELSQLISVPASKDDCNEALVRRHIVANPNGQDKFLIDALMDAREFADLQKQYFGKVIYDPLLNKDVSRDAIKNFVSAIRSDMDKARHRKKS